MTSNQTRRSSTGKSIKAKPHSRSSSSTTISVQIETPSDSSPSTSPSIDMPPRTSAIHTVHGISEGMENAGLNGSRKSRKGPLNRKQSTPMMPAFMVSAPGKVIVFGEHAVVHGKVRWKVGSSLCISNESRRPLQHLSLFDPICSSRHSPNPNEQSPYDSPTSISRIPGTSTIYHGVHSPTHQRKSTTTTPSLLSILN